MKNEDLGVKYTAFMQLFCYRKISLTSFTTKPKKILMSYIRIFFAEASSTEAKRSEFVIKD